MIIWLTGHSGAGKTTLAIKLIQDDKSWIMLDGDELRQSISIECGFSRKDRRLHNLRVARLANILSQQKNIIVSVIAPLKAVRQEIDNICHPIWIYVKRTIPRTKGHFYEEPTDYFIIDNNILNKELAYRELKYIIKEYNEKE